MKSILTPLILAVALTSCGVLRPVEDRSVSHILEATAPARNVTGNSPVIAVARPSIPGYLDRQQLVTRTQAGNPVMNNNQIWAESLDEGIARVTAENLGRMRNSLNIQPVQAFITVDYTHLLEIRVIRFDADVSTRSVRLECTWRLQPVSGRLTQVRSFRTEVPIDDFRFSATSAQATRVAAMNEALRQLAEEISRRM